MAYPPNASGQLNVDRTGEWARMVGNLGGAFMSAFTSFAHVLASGLAVVRGGSTSLTWGGGALLPPHFSGVRG